MAEGWVLRHNALVYATSIAPQEVGNDVAECRIKASALNHRDLWITKGLYPKIVEDIILGSDGCVECDGSRYLINPSLHWGASQSVQSDTYTVLGMPNHGTFANSIQIGAKQLEPCPVHLSDIEAAALPLAGLTAYRALVVRAGAKPGDRVLINGIGGGVALFALQMALALGCEVVVTSGTPSKIERALTMGAKAGYLYAEKDWGKQLMKDFEGVDVVVDGAGGEGFNELIKVSLPGARLAMYGATHGKISNLNPQVVFWRQLSILGTTMGSNEDFRNMLEFVNLHKIRPIIDTVLPLMSLPDGMALMEQGNQFGKIVFTAS